MLTRFKSLLLLITTSLLSFTYTNAQNLLTNGDFESGGSGNGFLVSNYTLINPVNGTSTPGRYAWTTNPNLMNSTYISGGDHTSGSGKMLVIDGATSSNQFFWTATSTGGTLAGFTIGTTYTFSFYVKSVSNDVTNTATQTTINAFFVNASNYNPSSLSTQVPLPAVGWQKVSFSFTANATNVLVRLFTSSTSTIGNDFAVDDFEIKAGALPLTLVSNSSTNPSCPTINDGTITATASGGSIPYNYALTGTSSANNSTGKFTNLLEGTYTVTITDFAGVSLPPITGIVLTAPNPLAVSATLPTVCPGSPTTISVSGATTGYTWTANPTDPSLTTPNSASITVSPTQTTTYTASTGKTTSTTNLINNGDFELGNTDFTSDYITNVNPNPFGIKKAYAIVTNPKSWFTAFSICPDKTSGAGNMMVADGSDQNGGNDRLWIQNGVSVEPYTDYDFSYYLQSLTAGPPARIEIFINGVSLGVPKSSPPSSCTWEKHTYKWNSGSNSFASIVIYDRETSGGGNDFAIDDISLVESPVCPLSKSITITVNSTLTLNIIDPAPVCSGGTVDITLPAVTLGSTTGTTLTYWTDAATTIALLNPNLIATSGTYYIKSTLGSCSITKPVAVTINNSSSIALPAVNTPINYCQNSVASQLTAISSLGATLNWYGTNLTGGTASATPPTPSTTSPSSTKYYVSQTIGTCESLRAEIEVVVSPSLTPTFDPIAAVCQNATAPVLPTNSTNSPAISGTWNPSSVSTTTSGTTLYTFTPSSGSCYSPTKTTISITVNPSVAPNFAQIPVICSGDIAPTLNLTSPNGISGTWSPATVNNTTNGSYIFTPNPSLFPCSPTQKLDVVVTPKVVPTFVTITPLCQNSLAPILPTTSDNTPAINGSWNSIVDTSNSGTTVYTFSPNLGVCATTATLSITIIPKTIPDFNQIAPICEGTILAPLPTTSKNGVQGSWSPALDKTKTTTYTFTPNVNECASVVTMTITVTPNVTPIFNPVAPICSGEILLPLPTTSTNTVSGSWSPALDNTKTTTYTFTTNSGQCATTNTVLTITVNPNSIPLFDTISPICSGASLPSLPTISTNGISGLWTPALDTTKTTTYTFTPSSGQCALTTTLTITVNPKITPVFNPVAPICSGESLNALPTISNNGITGSWSPSLNNTTTTTYTFVPTNGECAVTTSLILTVNPKITPTFKPVPDICLGATLSPLPLNSTNGISGTWLPALNNTATTIYTFTPSSGQCATTTQLMIAINSSATITPLFNPISPICAGQIVPELATTSLNNIKGTWSPQINPNATTTYTFTPDSGQCAASTTQQIVINPLPVLSVINNSPSICSGTATAINLVSDVTGTTFTWNVVQANAIGGSAGSGTVINQLLSTAGNKPGEAIYSVDPIANECPGTSQLVSITVNPIPEVSANPAQQVICSGETSLIDFSSSVAKTTYSWTVAPNFILGASASTGERISQTLVNSTLLADTAVYTITPIAYGCSGNSISIPITVNPAPEVFGSGNTTICSEEFTNISLSSNILGADFSWTAVQTGVTGAKSGSGNSIEQSLKALANVGTTVYTITPILEKCKGNPLDITIKVNPLPNPSLQDGTICLENGTNSLLNPYTIESGLDNPNYNFEWFLNKTKIIGATGNSYEATQEGDYSLIVTDNLTSCVSKENSVTITKSYPIDSITTIVSDAFTQNATVTVITQGGSNTVLYQIDGGEAQRSNVFSNVSSGTHTITVLDELGCTNISEEVLIIDYPKFFTPNGDGSNDTWNIVGLNDQSNSKILIYDRYGKLLKQITTRGEGWDGTFNGYELPATDYWFTIDYLENNINKVFKAHFSLKR